MKKLSTVCAIAFTACSVTFTSIAQDNHLYIGANPAAQVNFYNGADFSTDINYVNTLTHTNAGPYGGYYVGNITFTALSSIDPEPAAPGSVIYAQLLSVQGPAGSAFAFWERAATAPTISLSAGTSGTDLFRVSENDGSPGSDPHGHVHGRRFTATTPGIYTVTFRALDLSTNGPGGGPIQTPSDPLKIYFQAGINLKSVKPDLDGVHVTFGAKFGSNWQVEANGNLNAATNWIPLSNPIAGSDQFIEVIDPRPQGTNCFYRVRSTP
ncbi:MAG: hypothetical protein H7Y43_02950 [Akkermansiaceae bacterium]|nr:hypothetical protein [Verrucomicrobiales bacterium]